MRGASVVLLAWLAAASVAAPVPKKIATNYFPVTAGSKWEYAFDGQKEVEFTSEVTELTETKGGRTVVLTHTGGPKSTPAYTRFRIDADGVSLLTADGQDLTPPRLDLRAEPKADDKWDNPFQWRGVNYQGTTSVGAAEKVTVPAGTFTALPHAQLFPQFDKEKPRMTWYANGVGSVKFEGADGQMYLLLKYTPGQDK